ncbi:DUF3429 domain-containing protein [Jannaschia sp. W003]|uniref:DUF3429 domain-containing protein n=1 Tax=Jannaschia sp. W003 TaxID=2867012 RepID=UPI0021A54425|nr:DUF3429 domain-containing protein [Jannaschia sp. W003]UWQ22884.1 DUF3429 domain-containing protein [Jannaschia sp. W003]
MFAPVPRAPLLLGLAGLLPFLWGVLTMWSPWLALQTAAWVGPRFVGPYVGLFYGAIILAFMSGVLWGFAAKAEDARVAATGYALSTLPALWAFFTTGGGAEAAAVALIAGFVGLLGLDWLFWRHALAPPWWMTLRVLLTAGVVLLLLPVAL